jgi:D-alanyl-D-alanine carboxypeptidase/D-alanyl-D-alanine-endopeptidase (penicillin-binding protein 4)
MRNVALASSATVALAIGIGSATAANGSTALNSLRRALSSEISAAGRSSGAYVVDLKTHKVLFAWSARNRRLPASVEKIYTTSTALLRFGSKGTLQTTVYGTGSIDGSGTWHGTLYLRGGGDPTFGSSSFDRGAYGTGATMQRLVSNLVATTGMRELAGSVVGDESYFDSFRGTAPYRLQLSSEIEGELSALAYDRGLADEQGTSFQSRPARFAAGELITALRSGGVSVPSGTPVGAGRTPAGASVLGVIHSPRLPTLIRLTNTPSDNFFAEMLLKGIGARFGRAGSSAAGAAVVKAQLAKFKIHPWLEDGSGLSRADWTTPRDVVVTLQNMASNPDFVNSLAVAGRTGTLAGRMGGTAAAGRCHAKTGTLHDVSNLAGYCRATDGHTLAFAFLMNSVDPTSARSLQDGMAVALASYNG